MEDIYHNNVVDGYILEISGDENQGFDWTFRGLKCDIYYITYNSAYE